MEQGIFAIKLYELQKQYGQLQSRILLCQKGDKIKLHHELERITSEWEENDLLLQNRVDASGLSAVSALAQAQLDYSRTTATILEELFKGGTENLESVALYAEYAIDFATQSMRYALLTALRAMEQELEEVERKDYDE